MNHKACLNNPMELLEDSLSSLFKNISFHSWTQESK
jgi:hypothetical protein